MGFDHSRQGQSRGARCVCIDKLSLKVEAAEPRDAYVEDGATRRIPPGSTEARLSGREDFYGHSYKGDEPVERVANGSLVVDDEDDRCLRALHRPGHATWNVAPWSGLPVAQSRPRWLSMIERLIDSPMPSPPDVVVYSFDSGRDRSLPK